MVINDGGIVIRNLEEFFLKEDVFLVSDNIIDDKFYIYVGDEFRFLIVIESGGIVVFVEGRKLLKDIEDGNSNEGNLCSSGGRKMLMEYEEV